MSRYEKTHPWLRFEADFRRAPQDLWVMLGECQSKIEHLAGAHLLPFRQSRENAPEKTGGHGDPPLQRRCGPAARPNRNRLGRFA